MNYNLQSESITYSCQYIVQGRDRLVFLPSMMSHMIRPQCKMAIMFLAEAWHLSIRVLTLCLKRLPLIALHCIVLPLIALPLTVCPNTLHSGRRSHRYRVCFSYIKSDHSPVARSLAKIKGPRDVIREILLDTLSEHFSDLGRSSTEKRGVLIFLLCNSERLWKRTRWGRQSAVKVFHKKSRRWGRQSPLDDFFKKKPAEFDLLWGCSV